MHGIRRWWRARSERKAAAKVAALRRHGVLLLKSNRPVEAEALLAEAARLSGDVFEAASRRTLTRRVERAKALARCGRVQEAETELREILARHTESSEPSRDLDASGARLVLARMYFRDSRLTAAEEECRILLQDGGHVPPSGVADQGGKSAVHDRIPASGDPPGLTTRQPASFGPSTLFDLSAAERR